MQRVTIYDVAKQAGVSITTVSKVVNQYPDVNTDTRKRVEEIIQKLEYVPDAAGRTMAGMAEPVVGLLINDLQPEEFSGSVYGFLSGVCHACRDANMGFLLIATDGERQVKKSLHNIILSKGLNGLVLAGFTLSHPYLQQLENLNIPCTCIDIETGLPNISDVTIDNVAAAREAVAFLIRSGRTQTALLQGPEDVDVSVRRTQGYCQALTEAGLPVLPQRMRSGDFEMQKAHDLALQMLKEDPKIDSFFCISDLMALGACQAVEESGRVVGDDISVIGFDDIPISKYLYGGLTTVRQNFYQMGYTAGMVTISKIQKKECAPNSETVHYELVIRSTAKELSHEEPT